MSVAPERELAVLQTVRLKGRIARAALSGPVGIEPEALAPIVDALVRAGLLADGPTLRLTDAGRLRLAELLAAERSTVDATVAAGAYADFERLNNRLKDIVSQWQIARATAEVDAERDAVIAARVGDIHRDVLPVIAAAGGQVPRLSGYGDRLSTALRRILEGDMAWLSRPIIDSYHTLWFELHEELIGLAGRSRDEVNG